jgi:NAD+ kinase
LGLVVHPTWRIEGVLEKIGAWASAHGLAVGQVQVPGQTRRVADPVEAADCDLLLGVGGDGTALVALHVGAPTSTPVLAVAAGSIGALTTVSAKRVTWALDQMAAGRWTPLAIPGLDVGWGEAGGDVAVVRDGPGQVMVSITVDACSTPGWRLMGSSSPLSLARALTTWPPAGRSWLRVRWEWWPHPWSPTADPVRRSSPGPRAI